MCKWSEIVSCFDIVYLKKKKQNSGPQPAGFKQAMPWLKKAKENLDQLLLLFF